MLDSKSTQSLSNYMVISSIDFWLGSTRYSLLATSDLLLLFPSFPRLGAPWPPRPRWSAAWPPSVAAWPSQPGRSERPAAASPPRRGRPCLRTDGRGRGAHFLRELFGNDSTQTTTSIFTMILVTDWFTASHWDFWTHFCQPRYPWWSYWSPPRHPSRSWTCHWRPYRRGCLDGHPGLDLKNCNNGPSGFPRILRTVMDED